MSADKRMYHRRKENGLCTECGKPLDNTYVMCDACRNKVNVERTELRKWYQQNGVCPRCRKEKLYGDEKQCLSCNEKAYVKIVPNRNREHYNETHREWSRRTHHEAIEKGICTRCRKRKADHGRKTCGICREKERTRSRLKSNVIPTAERAEMGLCYYCCEPVKPGYKVCPKCYDRCVAASKKTDRSKIDFRFGKALYDWDSRRKEDAV